VFPQRFVEFWRARPCRFAARCRATNIETRPDQRRLKDDPGPPFPYARESNGIADMGAYEMQRQDSIFPTSGEACVPLPPPT
jgi:hypothetical protein